VLKSAAKQRSAELLADFENQMGREYSFDQDEVWAKAVEIADRDVKKMQKQIAARCKQLGIPERFAADDQALLARYLINLGPRGVEAFDQRDRSLGVFADPISAARAVEKAAGGRAVTLAPLDPDLLATFRRRCQADLGRRPAGAADLHTVVDGLAAWAHDRGIDIDVAQQHDHRIRAAPQVGRQRSAARP
jgi:hypothetical protein